MIESYGSTPKMSCPYGTTKYKLIIWGWAKKGGSSSVSGDHDSTGDALTWTRPWCSTARSHIKNAHSYSRVPIHFFYVFVLYTPTINSAKQSLYCMHSVTKGTRTAVAAINLLPPRQQSFARNCGIDTTFRWP